MILTFKVIYICKFLTTRLNPEQADGDIGAGKHLRVFFEDNTFDWIECIYFPPLRDTEPKLSAGKRSRIAALLKKQYGEDAGSLVDTVRSFNDSVAQGRNGHGSGISIVQRAINKKFDESLGKQHG